MIWRCIHVPRFSPFASLRISKYHKRRETPERHATSPFISPRQFQLLYDFEHVTDLWITRDRILGQSVFRGVVIDEAKGGANQTQANAEIKVTKVSDDGLV